MWRALRSQCQDAKVGCDWLAIPHNSNISGGLMFRTENADGSQMTTPDAQERAANEPLLEIYQHKGSSECRTGANTTDEQCTFELTQRLSIFQDARNPALACPAGSFVRTAMQAGLIKEHQLGANPFQVGVIASTDTHNAIPGATVEQDFNGHQGLNDDTIEKRLYLGGPAPCPPGNDPNNVRCGRGRADDGSGRLAVVWAEENSRDALFAAVRRRETYGTSGTRPLVRSFAGDYAASVCADRDLAASQRAFYYARVLENPTCRWSTLQCNQRGVDCSNPAAVAPQLVACCDSTVPKTHQERAWASPIWYRPEGMGAARGSIRFGTSPGLDQLQLTVPLGTGIAHDLNTAALTVTLRDNDTIYEVTLPAGTLQNGVYQNPAGSLGGVRRATFTQTGTGPATLTLETVPLDLSRAERGDHMVDVEVRIGTYAAAQTRLWTLSGHTLATS